MSQQSDIDDKAQQVEAAYRNAASGAPPAELNARILQLANQEAETIRRRKHKIAPFSHSRWAGLSVAASVVIAASLVIVMQKEVPDQITFDQAPELFADRENTVTTETTAASPPVDAIQDMASLAESTSQHTTPSPLAERKAGSRSDVPAATQEMARPVPATRAVSEPQDAFDSFVSEAEAPPVAAMAPKRSRAAASEASGVSTRRFSPAIRLAAIGNSTLISQFEKQALGPLSAINSLSLEAYLASLHPSASALLKNRLTQDDNWQQHQAMLASAFIVARIETADRIIFVLNTEQDISGQRGTLTLIKQASGLIPGILLERDHALLLKIQR